MYILCTRSSVKFRVPEIVKWSSVLLVPKVKFRKLWPAFTVQVSSPIICRRVYHGAGLCGGGGAVQRAGDTPISYGGRECMGRNWLEHIAMGDEPVKHPLHGECLTNTINYAQHLMSKL